MFRLSKKNLSLVVLEKMKAWKTERRPLLVDCIIPDLAELVLDYAYELQGLPVYAIDESAGVFPWRVLALPNDKIATASHGEVIHILDANTGQVLLKLSTHTDYVKDIVMWGERLVSVSEDGTACVWNLDTGACERTLRQPFSLASVAVLRGFVVLGGVKGQLCVWDGSEAAATFVQDPLSGVLRREGPNFVLGLADRILGPMTTVADHTLVVQTPRRTTLYTVANGVLFLAYATQDRARLHSAANDLCVMCDEDCIHVWNAGKVAVVPYHRRLLAVCALQDGRFAVSDEDRTIRLYKIFFGSREFDSSFEVIDTQPSVVYSLVQLPDGRLAGADESCVRVWDTDTRACILSLPYSNIMHLQVIHSRLAVISPSLTFVE